MAEGSQITWGVLRQDALPPMWSRRALRRGFPARKWPRRNCRDVGPDGLSGADPRGAPTYHVRHLAAQSGQNGPSKPSPKGRQSARGPTKTRRRTQRGPLSREVPGSRSARSDLPLKSASCWILGTRAGRGELSENPRACLLRDLFRTPRPCSVFGNI